MITAIVVVLHLKSCFQLILKFVLRRSITKFVFLLMVKVLLVIALIGRTLCEFNLNATRFKHLLAVMLHRILLPIGLFFLGIWGFLLSSTIIFIVVVSILFDLFICFLVLVYVSRKIAEFFLKLSSTLD